MNEKPKISVIIPLYNTQDYIEETLYSITNQTFKDIEIIIINDGSTDNSLQIVSKIKDNRIKLESQKNQGQSTARNRGLELASGKYIYFMDSDDLLAQDMFEKCYEKCEQEKLDYLFFNAEVFDDTHHIFRKNEYTRTLPENRLFSGIEAMNLLIDKHEYSVAVWLNLIKREYLEEIKLKFHSGIIHEDELFTTILYLQAKRVSFLQESFFKRRVRPNSTMTTKMTFWNVECYFIVVDELTKFIKEKDNETKQTTNRYLSRMINAVIYKSHKLSFKDRLKVARYALTKYIRYTKLKPLLILFLKK